MAQLLFKQILKQCTLRSVVGLRCSGSQASSYIAMKSSTTNEVQSRRSFSMLQQEVKQARLNPMYCGMRYMGRMKDIMSGGNPTGESPGLNYDSGDEDGAKKDNTVRIEKDLHSRSDEITVLINGETVPLPADQLYTQIRCMNHEQVLSMVATSSKYLDAIEGAVRLSFRRLFFVCKKMEKEELDPILANLPQNEHFQVLCAMVSRQGPSLDADAALDMLNYLTFFGARTNSPAVKVYLQLAMNFINDLHLDQLALLSHIVHTMKISDAVKILREGLKILAKHFHVKDLHLLDLWRKIVLIETLGVHMKEDFKEALLHSTAKDSHDLKMGTAVALLDALAVNGFRDLELEHVCLEYISLRVGKIDVAEAKIFLSACKALHVYAQDSINYIAENASKEGSKWTFIDKLYLIKHLRIQGHINKGILDSVFADLPSNLEAISLDSAGDLISYSSDVRHDIQNEALSALVEHIAKLPLDQKNTETLVDMALGLNFLQATVPKKILDVCRSLIGGSPEDTSRLGFPDKILCLSHILDKPEKIVKAKEAVQSYPREESSMKGVFDFINKTITGFSVENGVLSESGHYVDHMVEIKAGSADTKRVAVLIFPENLFTRNTGQLKFIPYIICKAIQNDGQLAVVFNERNWSRIEERDRVEYLLQKIQHAEEHQDLVMIGLDNLG